MPPLSSAVAVRRTIHAKCVAVNAKPNAWPAKRLKRLWLRLQLQRLP